ncbi:MAG TPA: hypothetical protein VIE35_06905 [Dongiaceae bacterium]
MAAIRQRAAPVILFASIAFAGGSRPSLAAATPHAPPNFIGKWELLYPVNDEVSEIDEITSGADGMAIVNRGVFVGQQGNRRKCEWVAPALLSKDILYLKPAPVTCDDGETGQSVTCELRFISVDVFEAVCPPLPVTRYKRIP